jgi:hypothetical protein
MPDSIEIVSYNLMYVHISFMRLANGLSALYPKGRKEKRLLDAMPLAVPR